MSGFIPIAKPVIGEEESKAVEDVLNSGMLTQGEEVKRFEDAFSAYLCVKNSVACSNGTVALDMALKAIDIRPGDEVITPAFTFIATANAILYQGSKPVFADVDPRTFNIDPQDIQEKITPKTKAIIGVSPLRPALRSPRSAADLRGSSPGSNRGLCPGSWSRVQRPKGRRLWDGLLLLLSHEEHDNG